MEIQIRQPEQRLEHDLARHFAEFCTFRKRAEFESSEIYNKVGGDILRVQNGVAWKNGVSEAAPKNRLRVVHWNIERFITLVKGDEGEQMHAEANSQGLHGTAIFSKYPIESIRVVPLPRVKDAFHHREKRLGQRRALICRVRVGAKLHEFCAVHLDVSASPLQRAVQIGTVLKALRPEVEGPQLVGGDFNTTTYNLRNKWNLMLDLAHKLFLTGFNGVVENYMTPYRRYECRLFKTLESHRFDYRSFNDLAAGTLHYDVNDIIHNKKTLNYVPKTFVRWLQRRLEPWNGCVPLRLDWFAGRGYEVLADSKPAVVHRPTWRGEFVSDHNPIVVDVKA